MNNISGFLGSFFNSCMTSPNQQNNGGVINVNEVEGHKKLSNKYNNSFVKPSNLFIKAVKSAGDSLPIDMESIAANYKQWVSEGNKNEQRSEAVNRIVNEVKSNEKALSLSGLQLTEIPPNIGLFLPKLKKLDLASNQLQTLPENVFQSLTNLERLYLNNNHLNKLPENVFQSLTNLKTLWLHNNQLTELAPTIFQSLTNLTGLWLNNNCFTNLDPTIFQFLTNLRILTLENNQIERLDATIFQSLQNLEGLSIMENRLTTLDATIFQSLINLKYLLINDNPLTTIPPTVFEFLTNLRDLYLNNNRLVRFELSTEARTALQNARVNLQSNQLNAHTVQSLIQAQNAPGYVGPQYELSIHDPNAISTTDITCQDLSRLVSQWQNTRNIHPQWASLAHRSELNNMAIFLARLWNECPRDANHEIPNATRTMVQRILSAFEVIMNSDLNINDQLNTEFVGACMAAAETGVGTCIDKIAVALLLMDCQAALFSTEDDNEKDAINRDLRRIQAIIDTFEGFNTHGLYYDTTLNKVVNVATGLGSINVNQLPEAYRHSNYTAYATCAYEKGEGVLPEKEWRALQWDAINTIRQNNNLTPYTQIRIGDEVEDILGLINNGISTQYLTTLSDIPMRWGMCRTIKGGSDQESAVMAYLKSLSVN